MSPRLFIVMNPLRTITRRCSSPRLYEAFKHPSTHCFAFTALGFYFASVSPVSSVSVSGATGKQKNLFNKILHITCQMQRKIQQRYYQVITSMGQNVCGLGCVNGICVRECTPTSCFYIIICLCSVNKLFHFPQLANKMDCCTFKDLQKL